MGLGKTIRDDLVNQLPYEILQEHSRFQLLGLMVQNQIEQIVQLQTVADTSRVESSSIRPQTTNHSENDMAVEEEVNRNGEVDVKTEAHDSTRDADEDEDVVVARESHPEPSADPEEPPPTRYTPVGVAHMPDRVFQALNAVRAQISRAVKADWDNPHAAVVWGQVIAEDLTVATAQLRAALDSQNT